MEHLPTIILVLAIIGIVGYLLHRNKDSVKEFLGKFFSIGKKDSEKGGGDTNNEKNKEEDGPTIPPKNDRSGYIDQLVGFNSNQPIKTFVLPSRKTFAENGKDFAICLNRVGKETETNYLLEKSPYRNTVSRNAYYIMRIDGSLCIALGANIKYDKETGDYIESGTNRDIYPICYFDGEALCQTDCLKLKDGIQFLLGDQWFLYRRDEFDEEQIDEAFTSRRAGNSSRRQPNSGTPVARNSSLGRRVFKNIERKITGDGEYPFN